jgi:hypothetical protein
MNWLYGAGILAILILSMVNEPWFRLAFKLSSSPEADPVLTGFQAIAVLGFVATPVHYAVLTRLRAIVETVRAGNPFVTANAHRLQAIAWVLLALNLFSIVIGLIVASISTKAYPVHIDAGFSVNGWLAVLLTFVLARVFTEGAQMREDIEGTV